MTAVRVASRILQDSDVENTFVAASVSAEIVREFLCRSVGGTRARQRPPPLDDLHGPSTRPLV